MMAAATETTATIVAAAPGATDATAAELEWPLLEPLKRPAEKGDDRCMWNSAVAPAVTVLGRIVAPYIEVAAIRIPPDHDAIVSKLRDHGCDDAVVASFEAAGNELSSTRDGRAVIPMCGTAAEGGALLGRVHLSRTAEEFALELSLQSHYKGSEWLPVLLAALRYYQEQTAAIYAATPVAIDEWLSLASLSPTGVYEDLPEEWYMAVAPAVTAVGRIAARFLPNIQFIPPYPDAVVGTMQSLGLDEKVPACLAAWRELGSTPDGRAVIALCRVASSYVTMGEAYLTKLAADPSLDGELVEWYGEKECLPLLQAAVRYYRAQEAPVAGGVGAAGGGASDAMAGGAGTGGAAATLVGRAGAVSTRAATVAAGGASSTVRVAFTGTGTASGGTGVLSAGEMAAEALIAWWVHRRGL